MAKLIAVLLAVGIPLLWGVGMYYLFERWRRGNNSAGRVRAAADSGATGDTGDTGDTAGGRPAEGRPEERSDD
jgi:hypothetical protein